MSKQRILIADDDEVSRLILTNIFEKEYQVIQSNTVDNTLSILKDNSDFVLVLLFSSFVFSFCVLFSNSSIFLCVS